jgi:hypothetical protein
MASVGVEVGDYEAKICSRRAYEPTSCRELIQF